MILACEMMIFSKIQENAENQLFKTIKKSVISKITSIWCFQVAQMGFKITCTSKWIKNAIKTPIFFQNVYLYIFEPKNREVLVNSLKAPLKFSPFWKKAHMWAKNSLQYHYRLVRKMKLKSGHL